jgi:hypothetical protein
MTTPNVARRSVANDLAGILESSEVSRLIDELEATRWTGRPGYALRAMIGMALAKSLYALPTWTRTVALVKEHPALAAVIAPDGEIPSLWSCYRFTAKLRDHAPMLQRCIADVIAALKKANPVLGWDVAIDASDMPAYANGQRFKSQNGPERAPEEYSDKDASWGHRSSISTRKGGGFYGYRLHMAVCSKTDLPLAWRVETAKKNEGLTVAPLLDKLHTLGIDPETCAMDKGYDAGFVYDACSERGIAPLVPLKKTPAVKRGEHKPPSCEHGEWKFAGADHKRKATKWRCPTGECKTGFCVGEGGPFALADSARDRPLETPLPPPRLGRAGVRKAQERIRSRTAASARDRACEASRGPHDPRLARRCRRYSESTSRSARCVRGCLPESMRTMGKRTRQRTRRAPKKSYELKLSRAQHHLQGCESTINDWIEAAQKTVVEKPDPKHLGRHGAWIDPPPLPANPLALLIGDCLQCFRTALDHLALELASAFTVPLTDQVEKESEFPIFENGPGRGSAGFHKLQSKGKLAGAPAPGSGLAKIQGISPIAQKAIEGLQPYHRGHTFTDDPLWRLHELNRLDKHRVLHVIAATAEGFAWTPAEAENVYLLITKGEVGGIAGPVKGRTQVAWWRTGTFEPIDPKKKMRLNVRASLSVGFAPATPIVGGAPVLDVLREINDHIVSHVLPPLVGFLK